MKKTLRSVFIGSVVVSAAFLVFGSKTASAHGFVPHFLSMSVSDVTTNSAVLHGTVDSMHSSWNGHAWFEYGTNPYSGSYGGSWAFKAGIRGLPWIGQTDMTTKISGLRPNTTYYFHLKAENKNGQNVSEIMSFTTKGSSQQSSSCSDSDTCDSDQMGMSTYNYEYNTTQNNTITTTDNSTTNNYNSEYQNQQSTDTHPMSQRVHYRYVPYPPYYVTIPAGN